VIAIIGILAVVLVPNLISARNNANMRASQVFLRNVANGIEIKRIGNIDLPVAGTTCSQLTDISELPGSVQNCWYVPGVGSEKGTYKVTVESTSGSFFQYNGAQIISLTSYTP
jgi:type IV pilus assembly protein PilA